MPIATKSSRINISDEKKTKLIAEIFSKNIKSGDTLLFSGELGVGKTTFIKYLINSLQLIFNQSITEIPSPTFNLVNEYQLEKLIIPLLIKLAKSPEAYIHWPNRAEVIEKQVKKIIEITRG